MIIEYDSINLKAPPQNGLQGVGFSVKARGSVNAVRRIYRDSDDAGTYVLVSWPMGAPGAPERPSLSIEVPASNVNGAKRRVGPVDAKPVEPVDVMSEAEAIQARQRARLAEKEQAGQQTPQGQAKLARAAKHKRKRTEATGAESQSEAAQ